MPAAVPLPSWGHPSTSAPHACSTLGIVQKPHGADAPAPPAPAKSRSLHAARRCQVIRVLPGVIHPRSSGRASPPAEEELLKPDPQPPSRTGHFLKNQTVAGDIGSSLTRFTLGTKQENPLAHRPELPFFCGHLPLLQQITQSRFFS